MISLYINNTPNEYKQVSSTGNKITLQLQPSIILQKDNKYQLRVLSANIVYCQPNITSLNNTFTYQYSGTWYTKTLPTGIYRVDNEILPDIIFVF